ncbi:MAG: S1C family serine protease [Anaerolineae bacterium]
MSDSLRQLNSEMSTVVDGVRRSLVQITNGRRGGAGAGTIWHPDGLIITNAHVVQRPSLHVTLPDGRKLPARVLAYDSQLDLAALTVDANDLPTIEPGESTRLRPGDWVLALGHPWGVMAAATAGVVIDVGVPLEMAASRRELIQVSLRVRPGNSGGPLVDVDGRLVGINMMMAGPSVGLAVPVHVVKSFLRQALA